MSENVNDRPRAGKRPAAAKTDNTPRDSGRELMRKMAESDKRRSQGRYRPSFSKKAPATQ
jgi:hypothetical protein